MVRVSLSLSFVFHSLHPPLLFCLPWPYTLSSTQVRETDGRLRTALPLVSLWDVECAVCGCTPEERGSYARGDWLWAGSARVCSDRCRSQSALRPQSNQPTDNAGATLWRLERAGVEMPETSSQRAAAAQLPSRLSRAVDCARRAAGSRVPTAVARAWDLIQLCAAWCSLVFVRLPVFLALSWALGALCTSVAIFTALHLGRAALQVRGMSCGRG
jgi:hypothetical protein